MDKDFIKLTGASEKLKQQTSVFFAAIREKFSRVCRGAVSCKTHLK